MFFFQQWTSHPSYSHEACLNDITGSAKTLFNIFFTEQEKSTCTVGGRNRQKGHAAGQKLDEFKRESILGNYDML